MELPFDVDELVRRMKELTVDLNKVRYSEAMARRARDEAKDDLETTEIMELAAGGISGKNPDERKTNAVIFFKSNAVVQAARANLSNEQANLDEIAVAVKTLEDQFSACRNIAKLWSAAMNYLSNQE